MTTKTDNISVKDLKKGDYIYNEVVTNEGTFGYISIFNEIDSDGKFNEFVAAGYKMPKGYEDKCDFLYYYAKGVIPNTIRYANDDEIEYLDTLLNSDGCSFCNGHLSNIKHNQVKRERVMAAPKINKTGSEEVIEVFLSETKHPKAFNAKVKEIVEQSGMTEEEAKDFVRTTPFILELYYHVNQGLFGVESEAVEGYGNEIYSPYTGEECDRAEVDGEEE